jgi:hypothetical protein
MWLSCVRNSALSDGYLVEFAAPRECCLSQLRTWLPPQVLNAEHHLTRVLSHVLESNAETGFIACELAELLALLSAAGL